MVLRILIFLTFIIVTAPVNEATERSLADTVKKIFATPTPTPHKKKSSPSEEVADSEPNCKANRFADSHCKEIRDASKRRIAISFTQKNKSFTNAFTNRFAAPEEKDFADAGAI